MSPDTIATFEKRFEQYRYKPDLVDHFTPEEICSYLSAVSQPGTEYRTYPVYATLFKAFPAQTWLTLILAMLDKIQLMPEGIPYTAYHSTRHVLQPDGSWSEKAYETYHPAMQVITEAVKAHPDCFKDRLNLLFIHDISPGREEEAALLKTYGGAYLGFFRTYVSVKQAKHELVRAIVSMLLTENLEMKALAAETIQMKLKMPDDLRFLNNELKAAGLEWQGGKFRSLHSEKPLHLIFQDHYLQDQSDRSFIPVSPLHNVYRWGGWTSGKKASGKALKLHHILTLSPVPEDIGIQKCKASHLSG